MITGRNSEWDGIKREVSIDLEGATLEGTLTLPKGADGLVLFAHGSGSSRHSPRNRYVAQVLQSQGIATLLIDLLTRREESIDEYSGQLRFDIPFLAKRLIGATNWITSSPDTKDLRVGYFGASTGAGCAHGGCRASRCRFYGRFPRRSTRSRKRRSRRCSCPHASDCRRGRRTCDQYEQRSLGEAQLSRQETGTFQVRPIYLKNREHRKK